MSQPASVRTAHARIAALKRWHPNDVVALADARRDLDVAQATELTVAAAALLRGGQ